MWLRTPHAHRHRHPRVNVYTHVQWEETCEFLSWCPLRCVSVGPCIYPPASLLVSFWPAGGDVPLCGIGPSNLLAEEGCHHWRASAGAHSPPPSSHRSTKAVWVSWGMSLDFQLSFQRSDPEVPKLLFTHLCSTLCPVPSWTLQESLKSKQLQNIKVKTKAWHPSSASGWLCDLGQIP